MKKRSCERCYRDHYNVKKNRCNNCLGRVYCKVVGCNKMVDKEYKYCFKCNKANISTQKTWEVINKGVCLIESDDD